MIDIMESCSVSSLCLDDWRLRRSWMRLWVDISSVERRLYCDFWGFWDNPVVIDVAVDVFASAVVVMVVVVVVVLTLVLLV